MKRKYKVNAKETINTINSLLNDGITKLSVLIRHSDRHFSKIPDLEPFMCLTTKGKKLAFDFGAALDNKLIPRLYSSTFGRCVETAYLIDKGFTKKNKINLAHNYTDKKLAPFYIKDINKAVAKVRELGNHVFLRNWFDRTLNNGVMQNPQKTADILCKFMIKKIDKLKKNEIAICVSHDWNIYPLKEFKMNPLHKIIKEVGYLDGVIFFEKKSKYYITSHKTKPILYV